MVHENTTLKSVTHNGVAVKSWTHNGKQVFVSGNNVTYHVGDKTYTEFVEYGESCLSPKSFVPTMSGWTFVGWRSDNTANSNVYTSYVMESNAVNLYAVFKQTVTVTYIANGNTSTNSGTRYCNSGNYLNPTFTISNPTKTGATFKGWSTNSGSATVTYANIVNREFSSNITVYAVFKYGDTVLLTKDGFGEVLAGESAALAIDASMYSAVTLANWSYFRGGTTNNASGGTSNLYLGSTVIASVNYGSGYHVAKNTNINGTYTIGVNSGTVKMYCGGGNYQNLTVESGTATITGVGKTVVG